MRVVWLAAALALGILIAYVDSRPGWDDTGITAAVLLILSGLFGYAAPQRPWAWALALGAWIPLLGVLATRNYASALALLIAFIGAYAGAALRRRSSMLSA